MQFSLLSRGKQLPARIRLPKGETDFSLLLRAAQQKTLAQFDLPRRVRDAAKKLGKAIRGGFPKEGLEPQSPQKFLEHQREYLQWMRAAASSDSLTVGQYHDLRKAVRDYRIMFELMVDKDPNLDNITAGKFLRELSRKMGAVKDGLLIPADRKKAENFLETPTKIDPDSKRQVLEFLDAMQDYMKAGP